MPVSDNPFRYAPPFDLHYEGVKEYKIGGLHPVHLGQKFNGGRYTIVWKIAPGGSSTVWLAKDSQASPYPWVALKFLEASLTQGKDCADEVRILK